MTKTVELALNDVNENDAILAEYELELIPQIIPGIRVSTFKLCSNVSQDRTLEMFGLDLCQQRIRFYEYDIAIV